MMTPSSGVQRRLMMPPFWRRMTWQYVAGIVIAGVCIAAGTTVAASATLLDGSSQSPVSYVALGDSYSSGEGNPPFLTGSDTRLDSCHRSNQAWPFLIPSEVAGVGVNATDIACSGAEVWAMYGDFKTEKPQLTQLKHLSPTPNVISITLGGNDIGFGPTLTSCFIRDCVGPIRDAEARLSGVGRDLTVTYKRIHQTVPTARIVVVGYPNIFPNNQANAVHCGWLTPQERSGLVKLASDLDNTIRAAASNAGVAYVSTLNVMAGHELCTQVPWINPLYASPSSEAQQRMGHPNAAGQAAIASVTVSAIA